MHTPSFHPQFQQGFKNPQDLLPADPNEATCQEAPQQLLQHSPAHGAAGGSAWSWISKQYFRTVFGTACSKIVGAQTAPRAAGIAQQQFHTRGVRAPPCSTHCRQLSICQLHTTEPPTPSQSSFSSKRLEKSTAVSKSSATYLCAPTFDFRHIASCFQNHSAQHARTHPFLRALKA